MSDLWRENDLTLTAESDSDMPSKDRAVASQKWRVNAGRDSGKSFKLHISVVI